VLDVFLACDIMTGLCAVEESTLLFVWLRKAVLCNVFSDINSTAHLGSTNFGSTVIMSCTEAD
jgi:hypothetical protein